MIVSKARKQFLKHCRSALTLAEHTLRAYKGDLKIAESYFGVQKDLESITKNNLRQYIRHLRKRCQYKESSIKRRIASLKLLFRWAKRESRIPANPFDTLDECIRLPRRLPRAIDRAHANLLRTAVKITSDADDFNALGRKTAIHVLLDTGIRIGELTGLKLEDVSLKSRCLKISGKGNRERLAYFLSATLYRSLSRYLAMRQRVESGNDTLFINANGRILTQQQIRESLCDTADTAGINRHITPHMLRHTCATQWLEAGLDIRYVQKLLGHQSISTTEIYTHVSDQGLREALLKACER